MERAILMMTEMISTSLHTGSDLKLSVKLFGIDKVANGILFTGLRLGRNQLSEDEDSSSYAWAW